MRQLAIGLFCAFLGIAALLTYLFFDRDLSILKKSKALEPYQEVTNNEADFNKIENGIHLRTGFVEDEGLMLVVQHCTSCHSAKLVTQNRMGKEQWKATIRWMQETQNLWDLGKNEEAIVNYLAKNYAPVKEGRRKNLENIDWYELEP